MRYPQGWYYIKRTQIYPSILESIYIDLNSPQQVWVSNIASMTQNSNPYENAIAKNLSSINN